MLALIYKDLYTVWRYNRLLLLVVALFLLLSGVKTDMSVFYSVYASVMCTAMGFSALAYDERSKWLRYADGLPYGRKTVVRSKYLLSLLLGLACIVLMALMQLGAYLLRGDFSLLRFAMAVCAMLVMGTADTALTLPIAFRIGVERARILCVALTVGLYIMVARLCMISIYLPSPDIVLSTGLVWAVIAGTAVLCAAVWAASCALSVRLYQNREL